MRCHTHTRTHMSGGDQLPSNADRVEESMDHSEHSRLALHALLEGPTSFGELQQPPGGQLNSPNGRMRGVVGDKCDE